jgi:hypothetical protein
MASEDSETFLRSLRPFLLIARTGQFFTADLAIDEYCRMLGVPSIWPAAHRRVTASRGNTSPTARITLGPFIDVTTHTGV